MWPVFDTENGGGRYLTYLLAYTTFVNTMGQIHHFCKFLESTLCDEKWFSTKLILSILVLVAEILSENSK